MTTTDHDILITKGHLVKFNWEGRDSGNNHLIIEDETGVQHRLTIPNRTTALYCIMSHTGNNSKEARKLLDGDQRMVEPLCSARSGLEPRVFKYSTDNVLFCTVSEKYQPLTVTELEAPLRAALPDAKVTVKAPTGRHGGFMTAEIGTFGPAFLNIHVNTGSKNGQQSARAHGYGIILANKSQLTLEATGLLKDLVVPQSATDARHTKTPIESFVAEVASIRDGFARFSTACETAKKVRITRDQGHQILDFYHNKGLISEKTCDKVKEILEDLEIQGEPWTMYGLSMAICYVGTHVEKVSGGVQVVLRRVGGEILLVSDQHEKFLEIINSK